MALLSKQGGLQILTNKTILDSHPVSIQCRACNSAFEASIGFVQARRQMECPACSQTIVLGTSDIGRQIRSVQKSLAAMEQKLETVLHKTGEAKPLP